MQQAYSRQYLPVIMLTDDRVSAMQVSGVRLAFMASLRSSGEDVPQPKRRAPMPGIECLPVKLTRSVLTLVTVAPALANCVDVDTVVL